MPLHLSHTNRGGYVEVYQPEHHRANKKGYVLEHIAAYEKFYGTIVPEGYVVHHINGVKSDNRPENLAMMTRKDHVVLHHTGQKRSAETREKISEWAKRRLSDPINHPLYLELDEEAIKRDREDGITVREVCKKYGISQYTYYKRIKGYRRKKK